jgi:toxin ParE1/3/4
MRIRWLATVRHDVDEITAYIVQDNPLAAANVYDTLHQQVGRLADPPYLGRSGRVSGTRERVITPTPYLVAHRVTADTVTVLRVLHGARQWPETLG